MTDLQENLEAAADDAVVAYDAADAWAAAWAASTAAWAAADAAYAEAVKTYLK